MLGNLKRRMKSLADFGDLFQKKEDRHIIIKSRLILMMQTSSSLSTSRKNVTKSLSNCTS